MIRKKIIATWGLFRIQLETDLRKEGNPLRST